MSLSVESAEKQKVFFDFVKAPNWSIESDGDLTVWPKVTKNKDGFFIANRFNLELYAIKTGQRIWQRPINDPRKPFIRPNGSKVMIGDDAFWVLKSPIEVSDEYVAVHSKNAELNVFRIVDGNQMLRRSLESEGVSKPLLVMMSLLGNRDFVFSCTSSGQILNIAVDDKSVRSEEPIGNNENPIIGIELLNDHFYVVIFEKSIKCFSLSNSRVKWEKQLILKAESYEKVMGKIYVWHKNVLVELAEELNDVKTINIPDEVAYKNATGDQIVVVSQSGKVYRLSSAESKFVEVPLGFPVTAGESIGEYLFLLSEGILHAFDTKQKAVVWKSKSSQIENISVVGHKILGKTKSGYLAYPISE